MRLNLRGRREKREFVVGVWGFECGWRDGAKVELPSTMPEMLYNRSIQSISRAAPCEPCTYVRPGQNKRNRLKIA